MLSDSAILLVWGSSILLFLVVGIVVGVLLEGIRRTAGKILEGAASIWTHGQLVANNTIQIPLFLQETQRGVAGIRTRVGGIGGATRAISEHAASCPGCPQCVLQSGERS